MCSKATMSATAGLFKSPLMTSRESSHTWLLVQNFNGRGLITQMSSRKMKCDSLAPNLKRVRHFNSFFKNPQVGLWVSKSWIPKEAVSECGSTLIRLKGSLESQNTTTRQKVSSRETYVDFSLHSLNPRERERGEERENDTYAVLGKGGKHRVS